MYSYQTADAVECFANARNLNAALKKMIKSDAAKDPKTARFIKAFKLALKSPKESAISAFVEKALTDYDEHLFFLLRHAFSQQIEPILDSVIGTHADAFNETYQIDPMSGAITIQDESAFKDIGGKAVQMIGDAVEKAELPSNGFMKLSVVHALFDKSVLKELKERLPAK